MFTRILICSDGSASTLRAARAGALIAQKFEADVLILNVYQPSCTPSVYLTVPGGKRDMAGDLKSYIEELRCGIEKDTGRVLDEIGVRYTTLRESGHPVDRIAAVAKDEKVDLIVLGRHGMSRFHSLLLGSVVDGVMHHTLCPVLIVQ